MRLLKQAILASTIVIFGSIVWLGLTHHAFANGTPPSDPTIVAAYTGSCPSPPATSGYTIHGLFATAVSAPVGNSATITLTAQSYLCPGAPYATVNNISITILSATPSGTAANFSTSGAPISLGSISGRGNWSNAVNQSATVTNLQSGTNCWDVAYRAQASYGSGAVTSNIGHRTICVNYTPSPQNVPPTGTVHISCDAIWGIAYDNDSPNTAIRVDIYKGGPWNSGAPGWNVWASQGSGHEYSLDIRGQQENSSVTYYVYFIGVDGSGNTDGNNPLVATPSVGPCNRPPVNDLNGADCSNVYGWAFDPDWPEQSIQVDLYIDGAKVGTYTANDPSRPDVNAAFGIPGNHGIVIPIPDIYKNLLTHNVQFVALGVDAFGNANGNNSNSPIKSFGPCAHITCGTSSFYTPGTPEANEPFQASYGFDVVDNGNPAISRQSGGTFTYSVNVAATAPLVYAGPSPGASGTLNPGDTTKAFTVGNFSGPKGAYNITYTITVNGVGTIICSSPANFPPVTIYNIPYLRVYGGDTIAGIPSFGSCTPTAGSRILGYNKGPGPNAGAGSGVQLLAQAMGSIDGFSSATGRTATPVPVLGLSLANTSGTYGGSFGASLCNPDYYNSLLGTSGAVSDPLPTYNPLSGGSDTRSFSSSLTITPMGPGVIGTGIRKLIFVNGDVLITDNIRYNPSGWNNNNIPSFTLIVTGNIYILPTVTQLDGTYIAQPNGAGGGGTIYTCATGAAPLPAASIPTTCDSKLTINGSFIAKAVKFLRSHGSLRNSSNTQPSSDPDIAEIFNYGPEIWLRNPVLPKRVDYDAITTLPPTL